MLLRKSVLLMLAVTVFSPIVLFTNKFGNWSSKNEFMADVSAFNYGEDNRKMNLLPQEEPMNILKEPAGVIYSDNSTKTDASAGESSSIRDSVLESMEHKSRTLYTTDNGSQAEGEDPIRLVTDGVHKQNRSGLLQSHQSTNTHKIDEMKKQKDFPSGSSQNISNNTPDTMQSVRTSMKSDTGVTREPRTDKRNDQTAMPDAQVRQLKDQLIRAKVYLSLAATKNNAHFIRELRLRMKESQRALGDATKDSGLPRNAFEKSKAMERILSKGKEIQDDCVAAVKKLRAMLHTTEEQLRVHKKQTMFLSQLTAKSLPKGLHCLPLRLATEYYTLNSSDQLLPNQDNLEDTSLFHYALFSDNVLATAVVVNSTLFNAKDPSKHVFHIVTDRLNYAAMRMWFLANPPGEATIQVQNVEEFTWLNSSYSPVLKQLGSPSMIDYYFKAHHANSDSNLKFRNPKYLSILNHLRFYLPGIFPKLNKVLFLDDDIVVQKDLTALWSLDLKGNVNGAVETCGESFHRFDRYLNFSNPLISKNFDPHACGWAYGMNLFDLKEWKRQNITEVYHKWQKLNHDRQLWKLGTLPPGLITFWKRIFPLDRSWHVLGLGYNPDVSRREIERAAVIHYNGNMKPWLEISLPQYRNYWAKFINFDLLHLRECNISP